MWQEGLLRYDEMRGLGWEWQSVDGCMVKAPHIKLLEATLRSIVTAHLERANVCLDAG
jgi:hypothetical protein